MLTAESWMSNTAPFLQRAPDNVQDGEDRRAARPGRSFHLTADFLFAAMRYVYVHRYILWKHEWTVCLWLCVCTQTFTVLHMSCVLVIQQYRKMRQHERWMQFSPVLRGREMVTQRRVGTCRGQQSPRCCSWLFPGWDLQPWVTCPADTQGRGVPGHTSHTCVHWAAANSIRVCVTWKTSVWLGLGCVCCSPACWEWCWFCHWDQTSLGRPWNWAPLWLLSPDTSGHTRSQGEEIQTLTSFLWHLIRWLFCYKQSTV